MKSRKAFTLIELLVVIAIIAILAAILFPVFAQARTAAKKTADLSNTKQIGIGMQLYLGDSDDYFPMSDYRRNPSGSDNQGLVHWSESLQPYMKNEQIFVSPADKIGGWAPSCVGDPALKNRGKGWPSEQIVNQGVAGCPAFPHGQVARLSYVANQLLMPRKRRTQDTSTVVPSSTVEGVSTTILIAPLTEKRQCMERDEEFRTYRPTLAIYNSSDPFDNFANTPAAISRLYAIPFTGTGAMVYSRDILPCNNGTVISADHPIRYTHPGRFDNGNNYVHADTSAKFSNFSKTLSVDAWRWGTVAYSLGGGTVLNPRNDQPVTP